MTGAPQLDHRFARDLPELAVAWRAAPTPAPRILALDEALAAELGLDPAWLRTPDGLGLLTGTIPPEGSQPVAQAYAGHQFGGYSPRLGDGRALLMGEFTTTNDGAFTTTDDGGFIDDGGFATRGGGRDLHLKGSGRTPFARGGDGLAAVGPMLREYIVSRAMHALGIPTTRALAVVATGGTVYRETPLPGAVLARVAASHLRVGTFQYARATDDPDLLRRLADHAIARHYPEVAGSDRPYLDFYRAVVARQADLIARWMLTGFVHGVMNTDNMTISGETIDYGPCAFLDVFDPATVFSSIDEGGRYAYRNQPAIAQWNLARLAEALLPLLATEQSKAVTLATDALAEFAGIYETTWHTGLLAKIGLTPETEEPKIAFELLELMHQEKSDFTSFFRRLPDLSDEPFTPWLQRWRALGPDISLMNRTNPIYIPRNHLVEEALADPGTHLDTLVETISSPFQEKDGRTRYSEAAPPGSGIYRTFCGT
ncbi:protein adenylyltransferase SelO family protein [Actinoplanes sp. NPDC051851]|uniref:protein adenylyltransferase SelO n=1 Tax=Actinoplanes sp. NPDC051851 TaxID=3154753 RepID=UPI003429D6F9